MLNIHQTQGQPIQSTRKKSNEVLSGKNTKRHHVNINNSNNSLIYSSPNYNRHLKTEAALYSITRNKEFSEYNYIQDLQPKHESFLQSLNKSTPKDKEGKPISRSVYSMNKSNLKRRDSCEILKSKSQKKYISQNKTIVEVDNSNSSFNQKVGKFDIKSLNHMEKKI